MDNVIDDAAYTTWIMLSDLITAYYTTLLHTTYHIPYYMSLWLHQCVIVEHSNYMNTLYSQPANV